MKGYDPRTHLAILLLASLLSLLTGGDWQSHLLLLLSGVYLLLNRLMKKALLYGGVYILLRLLFVVSLANGLATLASLIYAFFKMIPMVMIGAALVDTSPSALLCAYQKMHAPQGVLVMLCILVRFFPVVFQEMQAIRDGIRARGIFPSWYSIWLHPVMAYECFLLPLVVRCLKLATELASAAELRGIECECRRTSLHFVGFQAADIMTVGLYALLGAAIYGMGGLGRWLN